MFLFQVEQKHRLTQSGILKRFSINCYGTQTTLEDIRSIKSEKYKELKHDKQSKEYRMWFLKYAPNDNVNKLSPTIITSNNKTQKKKQKRKKSTKESNPLVDLLKKIKK